MIDRNIWGITEDVNGPAGDTAAPPQQAKLCSNYVNIDLPHRKEKSVIFAIRSPREYVKSRI